MEKIDVIIIGAGAAGLMCAIEAGKRKRRVLVLESANKPGKKILMSGGGRCNFTNYYIHPDNYISHNPHFCTLYRWIPHYAPLLKNKLEWYQKRYSSRWHIDETPYDIKNIILRQNSYSSPLMLKFYPTDKGNDNDRH